MTDFWEPLRAMTRARIGLGRVGNAIPTQSMLELSAAHARARDAVHASLDLEVVRQAFPDVIEVSSRARDRGEYLRRPDLGRAPIDLSVVPHQDVDLAIVLADGLSPGAVSVHGLAVVRAVIDRLPGTLTLGPIIVAAQARVAIGDHIALAMGATCVLVVIGERPGLSVPDSVGLYLTHRPTAATTDAERNCISNVHPPHGLSYDAAASIAISLVLGARQLGRSGVDLKDTSGAISRRPTAALGSEQ